MKKLLVLCLSLFAAPFVLGSDYKNPCTNLCPDLPARHSVEHVGIFEQPALASDTTLIVEERDHLFILGVLSYLYKRLEIYPKPCWQIAALIAWDVENINRTPDFVIERNRNFEKQGNIFHAEMMAIEKASMKNKSLSVSSSLTPDEINKRLGMTNTTLYTSLEPCPFCIMGVTWSRIPRAVYFMADPSIRNIETYAPVSLPQQFCGRTLTQINPSLQPLALKINQELKELFSQGEKIISIAKYFEEHLEGLLRCGHELFSSYEVLYDQNKDLYVKLVNATELGPDDKNYSSSKLP
jgi:tRNA(Arg) A34 adenosine deaminase TadA